MRKTDINKYNEDASGVASVSPKTAVKEVGRFLGKTVLTVILLLILTGIVLGVSIIFYIVGIFNEPSNINLNKLKLNMTSHVLVLNDSGEWEDYRQLYSTENRVWVNFKDIPQKMIDAQIAIEDKRFYEHNGVDWYRTGGAIYSLATGTNDFGGSTITQQLIKNITDDNEVSITRKLREISRALKLEQEYSKDDIMEAYLNLVNYGSGCRGVQSAARLYFNKDIRDCTYAECAAIAGITQNPYAFDPLSFPEKNKQRREIVLDEMHNQGILSDAEYQEAMKESENMKFVGYYIDDDDDEDLSDWNWYDDRLFRDVTADLAKHLKISTDAAEDMVYSGGLNIYSAMDKHAQESAEKLVLDWKTPDDPKLDVGFIMMDFEGRVLATVGGRAQKDGRLLWDNASQAALQPGSTIKPLSSYCLALEDKNINFSSLIDDNPVMGWSYSSDGNAVVGPKNWYGTYYGPITVTKALNISSNAATVSVLKMVGMERSYRFLTDKLNFTHLNEEHDIENMAGLSIGGFYGGTTVQEITAAYNIFCNGGYYYEPYTYYYVTDSEGEVLLDNRDRGKPTQAISTETSTIMNRLLHEVVNVGEEEGLGYRAAIDGWDIIGKTGTTDSSYDNWFVGASPYAVAGIWTGHKTPSAIAESEQSKVHNLWHDIMAEYLKNKEVISFSLGGNVEQHDFMVDSGLLVSYNTGGVSRTGYYTNDNLPDYYRVETSKSSSTSDDDDSGDSGTDESGESQDPEVTDQEDSDSETSDTEISDTDEPDTSDDEPTQPEIVPDISDDDPDISGLPDIPDIPDVNPDVPEDGG